MKLKNDFQLVLSDELQKLTGDTGVFTASKSSKNTYILSWESDSVRVVGVEYLTEDVEKFIKNGDWIVIEG